MKGSSDVISHVSDTALWVAMYRAMETDRPDAIFRDPYARRLAGARGENILRSMPQGVNTAWAMIVRTKVLDEIVLRLVSESGVDEVLNLAAGLDARAYRLPLPASLRWTDVDFPDVIEYKMKELGAEHPACVYEAVGLDLSDGAGRGALFDRIDARANRVLVISEGLLVYLAAEQVAALAKDLSARSHFAYWLVDIASPRLLQLMNRTWGKQLTAGRAPFLFGPAEGSAFFAPFGWREVEYRGNWDESRRLNRRMRGAWIWDIFMALSPPKQREQYRKFAGSLLMERT